MNLSQAFINISETIFAKEFFVPVIENFDHIKRIPHFEDEYRCGGLIDPLNLSK